jgi:hypothetical protein
MTTWSGRTTAYEHKHKFPAKLSPSVPEGIRKIWVLDAQWSRCPVEVEAQVKDLWRYHERGNDHYIIKTTLDDLEHEYEDAVVDQWQEPKGWVEGPLKTDLIVKYIRETAPEIKNNDAIWLHWWW